MPDDEEFARIRARLEHCERALCGAIAQRDHFARTLRSVRGFAQAHHEMQEAHVYLHALKVGIPGIIEDCFGTASEAVRLRCRKHLEEQQITDA